MSDTLANLSPGEEAYLPEPTQPKSLGFQSLFWGANLVVGLSNLAVYQVLMPIQIATFAASQKIFLVAAIESSPSVPRQASSITAAAMPSQCAFSVE